MKKILGAVCLIVLLATAAGASEVEELEARLDAVKAKRQAAVSAYQAAMAQIENAQIKDGLLAIEEKALAAKLGELKEKAKAAATEKK